MHTYLVSYCAAIYATIHGGGGGGFGSQVKKEKSLLGVSNATVMNWCKPVHDGMQSAASHKGRQGAQHTSESPNGRL